MKELEDLAAALRKGQADAKNIEALQSVLVEIGTALADIVTALEKRGERKESTAVADAISRLKFPAPVVNLEPKFSVPALPAPVAHNVVNVNPTPIEFCPVMPAQAPAPFTIDNGQQVGSEWTIKIPGDAYGTPARVLTITRTK